MIDLFVKEKSITLSFIVNNKLIEYLLFICYFVAHSLITWYNYTGKNSKKHQFGVHI